MKSYKEHKYWCVVITLMILTMRKQAPIITAFIFTSRSIGTVNVYDNYNKITYKISCNALFTPLSDPGTAQLYISRHTLVCRAAETTKH